MGSYGCESTLQFCVLANIEKTKLPFSFISDSTDSMNSATEQVLQQVKEQSPLRIEYYSSAYMRAQVTIQFIREYIKANPIGEKKVAIVTHGMFCRCLSAAGIEGE